MGALPSLPDLAVGVDSLKNYPVYYYPVVSFVHDLDVYFDGFVGHLYYFCSYNYFGHLDRCLCPLHLSDFLDHMYSSSVNCSGSPDCSNCSAELTHLMEIPSVFTS